jgi:rod shape determining protein RodA
MIKKYRIIDYDFALVIMVMALTTIGIMAINSADPSSRNKQIAGFALGVGMMVFISLLRSLYGLLVLSSSV